MQDNYIVTNHGSVVYLLWLFIKHKSLSQWHGLYAHEQTVLPSPTCITSVPQQNNDMYLERYGTFREHRWGLVHHIEYNRMRPPHGIMGRLCRHGTIFWFKMNACEISCHSAIT